MEESMFAFGGAVHDPSPTWKVFLLLRFPKIINTKPYLSATISIIGYTAFASIDVNPNTQGQCIKLLNEAKGHGNDPFYQFLKNFVCKGFF